MHTAYLLTGSNMGNRADYMRQAIQLIQHNCGRLSNSSSFYETAAWGITNQAPFYNQALELQTGLAPEKLMATLLEIEEQLGRQRTIKMGPRIIDIDILLMDEMVVISPLITIPHPFLAERRFALAPLAEIAPKAIHPVLHKTIQQLLDICPDGLDVHKISITE